MTVAELIAELQELPEDARVYVTERRDETRGAARFVTLALTLRYPVRFELPLERIRMQSGRSGTAS